MKGDAGGYRNIPSILVCAECMCADFMAPKLFPVIFIFLWYSYFVSWRLASAAVASSQMWRYWQTKPSPCLALMLTPHTRNWSSMQNQKRGKGSNQENLTGQSDRTTWKDNLTGQPDRMTWQDDLEADILRRTHHRKTNWLSCLS